MTDIVDAPSLSTLTEYEGETFDVESDAGVGLRLDEVDRRRVGDDWEAFSLWFSSDDESVLPQGHYRFAAPDGEEFDVTVAPTHSATAAPETHTYEAVFDRPAPDGETPDVSAALAAGHHLPAAGVEPQSATVAGDEYVGQVILFGGARTIQGFYECDGALVSIQQLSALYSLIGTKYGGDGTSTFGLPNLSGRVPMHRSSQHGIGSAVGSAETRLAIDNVPVHSHGATNLSVPVSDVSGSEPDPDGNVLTTDPHGGGRGAKTIYTPENEMSGSMVVAGETDQVGMGAAFNNVQPSLAMNYEMCVTGIYPGTN
ncbi:phage tail protein [Salinirubrum litoreum]|uniref:Phage tail protein n=1 Tax=Salinirubrum litoreum TaxID=1126234 RepID=A0ABD5RF72_9EURY|nr:tail fiber protein [Salinirubrum litoreum]